MECDNLEACRWKVGDYVVATGKVDGLDLTGKSGRVVNVIEYYKHANGKTVWRVSVAFDEYFYKGHTCEGRCRMGHGRCSFNPDNELLLVSVNDDFQPAGGFDEMFE